MFSIIMSVNCPVRLQIEMLNRPLAGIGPIVNANAVACLQETRINSKPIRPKARALVPRENHRIALLQRRYGQTTTCNVHGLNCAVESRSTRTFPSAARAALQEHHQNNREQIQFDFCFHDDVRLFVLLRTVDAALCSENRFRVAAVATSLSATFLDTRP
jgi:hypothetical protein